MPKPSELNPDYVKFSNDKKQKKDTVRHLKQKLASLHKDHAYELRWMKRYEIRLQELQAKITELTGHIHRMENNGK